jgi:hypothetical protein
MKARFTRALTLTACGTALLGQDVKPTEAITISGDLKAQYFQIKKSLLRAAEKMPSENYAFKPTPPQRSFAGWIADVADSQVQLCSGIAGNPRNIKASSMTNKVDLQAALKQSFDVCDPVYGNVNDKNIGDLVPSWSGKGPRIGVLSSNVAHDNECYGAMAVYLRLKLIVPPTSEPHP